MSIEQKLCKVKIFQLQSIICVECDKMYWSKVCIQEFLDLVSGLDIQDENPSTTVLYAKKSVAGGEIRQVIIILSHILFFSSIWYEHMA